MIFYQVLGTSAAPCCLVGTQIDAKRLARERGTTYEQVDVPTDKAGLMAYVNELSELLGPPFNEIEDGHNGPSISVASFEALNEGVPASAPAKVTVQSVMEFILDAATVADVEQVFSAIGARFKELVK
jgi:hypothetical protein